MRGDPQAAQTRLLVAVPSGRWPGWVWRTQSKRHRDRREQLEVIERLDAQQRRDRRAGEYAPNLRRLW